MDPSVINRSDRAKEIAQIDLKDLGELEVECIFCDQSPRFYVKHIDLVIDHGKDL